jgi:hypothetical protein
MWWFLSFSRKKTPNHTTVLLSHGPSSSFPYRARPLTCFGRGTPNPTPVRPCPAPPLACLAAAHHRRVVGIAHPSSKRRRIYSTSAWDNPAQGATEGSRALASPHAGQLVNRSKHRRPSAPAPPWASSSSTPAAEGLERCRAGV